MAQRLKTDWTLFCTVILMVTFGLVIIYSASSMIATLKYNLPSHYFLLRQAAWALVGFCALMYFKRKDYRLLSAPYWAFVPMGLVLMMLLAVIFLDPLAHRWLRVGPLSLQPSEFAKPALAIFLAWFITRRAAAINNVHTWLPAGLALLLLAGTVLVGDLGTAAVLAVTGAAVFYVAGLKRRYFVLALTGGVLLAGFAILAKPYRLGRIIGYVDPEFKLIDKIDPAGRIKSYAHSSLSTRDPSYQARQSKIALGSGGPLGLGLMQGKQKILYLPEAHTDFIYAVIGEELGIWGCTGVLFAFLIILWRGLRLYFVAPDDFGRYLALSVTVTVVFQALINMSVVLDLVPTKGIPLPMISHGGSSLLSTLMSLGILLSVSEHTG
ncbi:MAG: FtsW/RodA/SpoVE family cell cycle protein [Bryobacteraceae bacterium]|nr:FtsW/RodA/SpoVE family cell cycle protein [Bryobacterales bacterium]MEB2360924.1 FtsW/RodA/SpoVE family cell cycle protein [Bryobacterales bacterium]NUN00329.1 FtsW/RodA/SpoVE family cell cycle protein [Bryobacteraceae bacterium]